MAQPTPENAGNFDPGTPPNAASAIPPAAPEARRITVGEEVPPGSLPRPDDHAAAPAAEHFPPPPAPPATFRHSERVDLIFGALAQAQATLENPIKTKKATIKSERGTYVYWYCDIADVLTATRKPFSDNGIGVTQFPTVEEKTIKVGNADRIFAKVTIETYLTHKSGQWMACSLWAMAEGAGPQALGSVITYLRRYGLQLIAGIAADDDEDGNAGQGDQPGGAGDAKGQPAAAAPQGGPQRSQPTDTPDPWIATAEVNDYREQVMGGGRTRYSVDLAGIGWASTTKKDLGQKIGREKGTGLSVKVQLKRFRNEIDLVNGEVVRPDSAE